MAGAHTLSTLPPIPHSISIVTSLLQRLRSLRHGFWYGVSERVRWSRGVFRETPVLELPRLPVEQAQRIAALRSRYQVKFELQSSLATALNNYEYLDILDRAWTGARLVRPGGGTVCDVGCASFGYAAALQGFFSPRQLIGVDVEGHRLFKDGRTRVDYAAGYVGRLPDAQFVVADYRRLELPADVITAWFPFVTAAAILAWRLPLSLLAPEQLFARIRHNLNTGGWFVMTNHGVAEAAVAEAFCHAAGLACRFRLAEPGVFSGHRQLPAMLSCWVGA